MRTLKKKTLSIVLAALFAALCLLPALPGGGLVSPAYASGGSDGGASTSSGLIFRDYTVYAQGSTRVLTDIFDGDSVRLEARFTIPDTITLAGEVAAQITGGGFSGAVNTVTINEASRLVTVILDLRYSGGAGYVMLNLSGSRSIGSGAAAPFDDPRNVLVNECHPEDANTGASSITPSAASEPPRFSVDLSAKFPAAKAGQKYVFEIPVKNVGKQTAQDITVTLDPGADSAAFPFEYDKYAFTGRIAELKVNSVRNVRFEVNVLPTAKDGQNTINVKFAGRTVLGVNTLGESAETIAIMVENTNTAPKLAVERIGLTQAVSPAAGADANTSGGSAVSASGSAAVIADPAARPVTVERVVPGGPFSLAVRLTNSGTLAAKDVKLTLKGMKADGISTDNAPDVLYIDEIGGASAAEQTFMLTCAEDIAGERTELTLSMVYTDATGKEYTSDTQLFIPLYQDDEDDEAAYTAFEFERVISPGGTLTEGDGFTVSFNLRNTGDVTMRDVKVSYTVGAEFIGQSLNTRMLKPIAPGEAVPLSYEFSVSKSYASGNFPIAFTVEYAPETDKDGSGGGPVGGATVSGSSSPPETGGAASSGSGAAKVSGTQYVGVLLHKPDETTTSVTTEPKDSVPKIIISNYEYSPREAMAGQTVDITLTFFNTSMAQTVRNIKIMLESEIPSSSTSGGSTQSAGVFAPIEGSNTFYIESIAPRAEATKSISLMIRGDAEAKSYPLYSSIEYEDSKSNAITTRESISIPVTQVTKIMIGDIQMAGEAIVGQPFNINCSFRNMGRTTLSNVLVNTDGPFSVQGTEYYAGNPQPGYEDYYDAMVTPEAPGDQVGYVSITYEDAAGNTYEERKEFQFSAMDMGDFGGMDPGMIGGGGMGMPGMNGEMPPGMEGMEGADGGGGESRTVTDRVVGLALAAFEYIKLDPALWIAIAIGLIILIVVVVKIIRGISRKKLERELDKKMEQELAALSGDGGNNARGRAAPSESVTPAGVTPADGGAVDEHTRLINGNGQAKDSTDSGAGASEDDNP